MEDLIKRSDAIKVVHDYWKQQLDRLPKVQGEYGEVLDGDCDSLLTHNKELSTRIKALPSADRPQGEWIRISSLYSLDRTYRCSVCGKVIDDMPMDEYYDPAYKGCPYCLARMKGADDE